MSQTENDINMIRSAIDRNVTRATNGCILWNGYTMMPGNIHRSSVNYESGKRGVVNIITFVWEQTHGVKPASVKVHMTCGGDKCVNVDHIRMLPMRTAIDHSEVWNRMLTYSERNGGCLVWNGCVNQFGIGQTYVKSIRKPVTMMSYIINNNNGNEVPDTNADGEKLVFLKTCQTDLCFEPTHMTYVTYEEKYEHECLSRVGTTIDIQTIQDGAQGRAQIRVARQLARERVWTVSEFESVQEAISTRSEEDENGCWIWQGRMNNKGYGMMDFLGKTGKGAHQFSCEAKYMRHQREGEDTCHSCDNPPCCNPDHLRFDTRASNSRDTMIAMSNPNLVLTEDIVRYVRGSDASNVTLGVQFGVHASTIGRARDGTWSHVV